MRSGYRPNDDFNGASQLGSGAFSSRSATEFGVVPPPLISRRTRTHEPSSFTDTLVLRLLLHGNRATGVSIFHHGQGGDPFSEGNHLAAGAMARPKSSCCQVSGRPMNWPVRYSCGRRSSGRNQSSGPSAAADELPHRREIALRRRLARRCGPLPGRPRPLDLKRLPRWCVPVNSWR